MYMPGILMPWAAAAAWWWGKAERPAGKPGTPDEGGKGVRIRAWSESDWVKLWLKYCSIGLNCK